MRQKARIQLKYATSNLILLKIALGNEGYIRKNADLSSSAREKKTSKQLFNQPTYYVIPTKCKKPSRITFCNDSLNVYISIL